LTYQLVAAKVVIIRGKRPAGSEETPTMSTTTTPPAGAIDPSVLVGRVRGAVYTPDGDGYDAERAGFQRRTAHRPAVIVGATRTDDVRAAVETAAEAGTRVAVQATGHGLAEAMSGGVLISTSHMSSVRVDPATRTAWVQAGATWGQVIEAAAPYGLAPPSGSFPGVGAVSYTLGGGVGLLARRYGFASDHARGFELVTPNGELRTVTAEACPELFWGLRGGGGNFGVVTGIRIALMPVSRIYGGGLFFDVAQAPGVLEAWRAWTSTVPEEMTSAISMLPFPDVAGVPESLRGRHVAQIQIAYLGPPDDGEEVLHPLREAGPGLRDTLRELPYAESGAVFAEPDQPHAYLADNRLVTELDSDALATLPAAAGPQAPVMCVVNLRHLGGALARAPQTPSAVGHREAGYALSILSPVEPGTENTARAAHRDALAPFAPRAVGRSLNFSYGPLDEQSVREGFDPSDYQRLTTLKACCDPHERLCAKHPIPARTRA
jgi:FAD/FMN-containing dehydrogenase